MRAIFSLRYNLSPVPVVGFKSLSSTTTNKSPLVLCSNYGIWLNGCKDTPLCYHPCGKKVTHYGNQVSLQDVSQIFEKDVDVPEVAVNVKDIHIDYIKKLLNSMDDGRITVSPYDTAIIALIKDLEGRNAPQFPTSLEWIAQNQLEDGSWGDEHYYLAYDRLINTLGCVVALKTWDIHHDKSEKGILYIKENLRELETANPEEMTCGFELIFPALLQRARDLGIDGIPYDAIVLKEIFAAKDRKLSRVPKDLIHKVPTCLLHNLEGLEIGLEWDKILKLQTPKGTFITSPSATAFAVMETKDKDCLEFISYVVDKFNGGAPPVYPVDIYARLWAVDRLERLGISRFFKTEIKDCLDYIHRYWAEKGVFSGRESDFVDIDDTSMGFRLLRLHGYDVSPNVLENFKMDNKFMCYSGQAFESPSPLFNLYRASQVLFPGEKILEEAREFTYTFLQEKLASNPLLDKWLISKHLPDEIKTGLDIPWYANLPRVETRLYMENYGVDDVWIGKSLYRMPEINNDAYIQLGKLDYNRCQAQHRIEWDHMQLWYDNCRLHEFGISKKDLLRAYFLATASIFELERSHERFAWAKSQIVSNIISTYFKKEVISPEQKAEFKDNIMTSRSRKGDNIRQRMLVTILLESIHQIAMDTRASIGRDVSHQLHDAWGKWLTNLNDESPDRQDITLLVSTLNICAGHIASEETQTRPEYKELGKLISKIYQYLHEYDNKKVLETDSDHVERGKIEYKEIEQEMQTLLQLVLEESDGINKEMKKTFFMVARAFYYRAYFTVETIDAHISKVLFEQVV